MRSESRRNRACMSAGRAAISAATVSFRISPRKVTSAHISILRYEKEAKKGVDSTIPLHRQPLQQVPHEAAQQIELVPRQRQRREDTRFWACRPRTHNL